MPAVYEKTSTCCNKLVVFERGSKPEVCPFCGTPYWDKPKDERRLFILQDEYIKNGRKHRDLEKIFFAVLEYAKNIVKSAVKSKKILSVDDLNEKAEDITTIFLESYLRNPEFEVKNSFGGLLLKYSKGVLYGSQEHDKNYSMDRIFADSMTIESNPLFFIKDPEIRSRYSTDVHDEYLEIHQNDIVKEIYTVIEMIYERLEVSETPSNRLKYLIGMKNFFELNKSSFMMEYYSFSGNRVKQHIENSKLLIRRYLLENQRSNS